MSTRCDVTFGRWHWRCRRPTRTRRWSNAGPVVDVPVVYGGELGPDLNDVALACGLDPEDVCQRHAAVEYVVCFVGFLPGFPYLGPLDTRLRLPRRATPRPKVPPGSVAIAGEYSGIYPWASPGGWHIIGRTDMSLFDSRRDATDPADAGDACAVRQRRVRAAMSGRADCSWFGPGCTRPCRTRGVGGISTWGCRSAEHSTSTHSDVPTRLSAMLRVRRPSRSRSWDVPCARRCRCMSRSRVRPSTWTSTAGR